MLVYVNNFNCIGDNSFNRIIDSISGWLNRVAEVKLTREQLLTPNNIKIGNSFIRTYSANKIEPEVYSVMYTHPDNNVTGRQWITEIGIRKEKTNTFISVLLEISDVSTLIYSRPITTRPSIVRYLKYNCTFDSDVVGQKVEHITNTVGDYRYLSHEIHRDTRKYPIIFISKDKLFPVKPESLQDQLFGMAQVVATEGDIDSWEMERILGRKLSSWGGAINIIYPTNSNGQVPNNLILPDKIKEIEANGLGKIQNYILSIITHSQNGYNKKKHISPTLTRAKRQKDDNDIFRKRISEINTDTQYSELLDEAINELDAIKKSMDDMEISYMEKVEDSERRCEDVTLEKDKVQAELDRVSFAFDNINKGEINSFQDVDAIIGCISDKLTPTNVLKLLELLLPNNLVILKSAYTSAGKSTKFKHNGRLLFLLYQLCTSYLKEFIKNGDSYAKQILGNAYSANESETVENSPILSAMREFEYNNSKIKMFKHVGIGVARNKSETIRIHFYIDQEEEKVIIGYCGEHLAVQSS
ncbi:TPA: hypothetical protein ACSTL0_001541 [Serratia fonticola]